MQDSQSRLAVINGLRAVAILGVVWHHTVYKLWLAPAGCIAGGRLARAGGRSPEQRLARSATCSSSCPDSYSYLPYATGRRHATVEA